MKFVLVFFLLVMSIGVPGLTAEVKSGDQARSQLTPKLFKSIEAVAQPFIKVYPPSEYYYFGLGRSPHGVLGYIDALKLGDVKYIPISNAKWHFQNPNYQNLRTAQRERFTKDFFGRFLPSEKELGGRTLLVVDYCDMGSGFAVGMYYVIETIFERGGDVSKIRGVGFNKSYPVKNQYYRNREKKEVATVHFDSFKLYDPGKKDNDMTLYSAMMYGDDDDWLTYFAPVGKYDFLTMVQDEHYSERRPEYQEFLEWLRKTAQTEKCAKVAGELSEHSPHRK